jgi:carbon-monoxide dehydrogenase medium subunit
MQYRSDGTSMKPAPFDYHAPQSLEEAAALLTELGDGAKLLGGGQSLIPMLALRLTVFDHLVDLGRIAELRGIERRNGSLWIGAGTTEAAVGRSPEVAAGAPLLARATPLIGHFQIRNRGTIGGSIAHADPSAEYPAVALALDAQLEAFSSRGRRTIPAAQFFTGLWSTELADDEILTAISFPVWSGRCGFAVEEIARRHGDFAIAGAVVGLELDGDDRIRRCAIGLIGLGSTPERARTAEAEVVGKALVDIDPADVGHQAVSALDAIPADLHGSSEYRTRVGAVMVERAWRSASEEARSG